MTISVLDIDQGPFTATGAAQTVPYTFMTLTDEEIEAFYDDGDGRVLIDPALHVVERNKNVDGSAKEGGSVVLDAGAAPVAASIYLRAAPREDRDLVWSDTGSRLRNLNDEADRMTLRQLVMNDVLLRNIGGMAEAGAAAGAVAGAISGAAAAEGVVGGKADADLSNVLSTILGAATISTASLTYAQSLIDVALGSGVRVEWFGAVGDSVTDDTAAIQAAIDYVAALPANRAGGVVLFGSACYRASNLVLKSRVRLRGMGYGMTQIRRTDTGTGSLLFIPKSATLFGWDNICFDGNSTISAGSGHGIEFEVTNASSGQSFSPFGDKVTQAEYSYKMASCWSFAVGHCRKTGIYINGYDFDVRFHDYRVSHCLEHGIYNSSTDSIFSLGYIEKNGWSGFHNVVGATKIYGLKSIFNCRQLATPGLYANIWIGAGQGIETAMLEAQDGYGDGIYLNCSDSVIIASSNQNGYKAFGQEDESSRIHTNVRVGSAARRLGMDVSCFAYKATVGTDGFWTTEWPYVINTAATFTKFKCDYDPARFNQAPAEARDILSNGNLGDLLFRANAANATFADISPKTINGTGTGTIRLFRSTQTGITARVDIHAPGTSTVKHRIDATALGPTQFNLDDGGNLSVGSAANGGKWNTSHLQNGPHHIWTDATGRTRTKATAPTSDTDGTAIQYANSGVTGSRPATPPVGWNYFDTTLGKPIWFKSPGWVDATGVAA